MWGIVVFLGRLLPFDNWAELIIRVGAGALVYGAVLLILKDTMLYELLNMAVKKGKKIIHK